MIDPKLFNVFFIQCQSYIHNNYDHAGGTTLIINDFIQINTQKHIGLNALQLWQGGCTLDSQQQDAIKQLIRKHKVKTLKFTASSTVPLVQPFCEFLVSIVESVRDTSVNALVIDTISFPLITDGYYTPKRVNAIVSLIRSLSKVPTIRTLVLRNNQIENYVEVVEALLGTNIHVLKLQDQPTNLKSALGDVLNALRHNQKIDELDLAGNNLEEAVLLVAKNLNDNIRALNLDNNNIQKHVIEFIKELVNNQTIRSLSLRSNKVPADAAISFADYLSKTRINSLDWAQNWLGEKSITFAQNLVKSKLRFLGLHGTGLGPFGIQVAVELLATDLSSIDLSNNFFVSTSQGEKCLLEETVLNLSKKINTLNLMGLHSYLLPASTTIRTTNIIHLVLDQEVLLYLGLERARDLFEKSNVLSITHDRKVPVANAIVKILERNRRESAFWQGLSLVYVTENVLPYGIQENIFSFLVKHPFSASYVFLSSTVNRLKEVSLEDAQVVYETNNNAVQLDHTRNNSKKSNLSFSLMARKLNNNGSNNNATLEGAQEVHELNDNAAQLDHTRNNSKKSNLSFSLMARELNNNSSNNNAALSNNISGNNDLKKATTSGLTPLPESNKKQKKPS